MGVNLVPYHRVNTPQEGVGIYWFFDDLSLPQLHGIFCNGIKISLPRLAWRSFQRME